jgi:hypothetical protein
MRVRRSDLAQLLRTRRETPATSKLVKNQPAMISTHRNKRTNQGAKEGPSENIAA